MGVLFVPRLVSMLQLLWPQATATAMAAIRSYQPATSKRSFLKTDSLNAIFV